MKIFENQLENYYKKGFENIKTILIYGKDEGGITEYFLNITSNLKKKHPDLEVLDFNDSTINEHPEKIYTASVSDSFFAETKLMRFETPPVNFNKILEDLLTQKELSALILIRAGDLKKSSKLVKICEKDNNSISMICYPVETGNLQKIISDFTKKNNIKCSPDAMQFLIANLGTDKSFIKNELEKIALYLDEKNEITYDIAKTVLTNGNKVEVFDVGHALTNKKAEKIPYLFNYLYQEKLSPIAIIRVTLNHLRTIYFMKKWQNTGLNPSMSAKKVLPYLFPKIEGNYTFAVRNWSKKKLIRTMDVLTKTEIKCKFDSENANIITQMTFLRLAK